MTKRTTPRRNRYGGSEPVDNTNRFRCNVVGCNPVMYGEEEAKSHKDETGHATSKWPVRSARGEALERERVRSGYYNKYNTHKPRPMTERWY